MKMPEPTLQGCRILVVEDEYMLADEVATELRDAGADVLGPAGSVDQALTIVAGGTRIDGAILDVNLRGSPVFPVADLLIQRSVPLLFTTGYDAGAIPAQYAHIVRCEKPVSTRRVTQAIRWVVHESPGFPMAVPSPFPANA